ncbi:hypothetical protein CsatB_030593 [Cannabis sativa]
MPLSNSTITTAAAQPRSVLPSGHHYSNIPSFRNTLTWFILLTCILYILYSSNLILTARHHTCPTTAATVHEEDDLESLPTNLSSKISKPETFLQDEQQHEKYKGVNKKAAGALTPTELKHVVFGIAASSKLWNKRKEYIKVWWRPKETRGFVWMDKKVRTSWRDQAVLPEIRISGDTSRFKYTNRQGQRSAVRISRVVSETVRMGMKDVRWFVMGDDDTVFVVENLVRVLSKYDHREFYYVGSSSESHVQNIYFSYGMAYGGGGFAISYPLAVELEKMQDRCIQRYPGLYGSDDRMQACMAELGVPLTREPGFHQYDVYGDLLGLLGAHPVTPLLSLHHIDVVEPIFPRTTRVKALQQLFQSVNLDSASIMQQSICYDKRRSWSISISWGYVVQILRGVVSPRELEMPTRTFLNWYPRADYTAYAFNTRPVTKHPCQKPYVFYMNTVRYDGGSKREMVGVYGRDRRTRHPYCRWKMESPERIDSIVVFKKPHSQRWQKSPRRDCCRVLPSTKKSTMYLWVGSCRGGEISEL